jgi:hypothetical protein
VVIGARGAHREIDRDIVFYLPDRADQAGAGFKLPDIGLVEEFSPTGRTGQSCGPSTIVSTI